MNDEELNYLLTNFACDRLDELQIWLEEKDCDRQFIYDVINSSLNLSIKNVEEQGFRNKKLLEEMVVSQEDMDIIKKQIRVYDIKWYYNYKDHTDQPKEEYDKTFNAEPTEMIIDVSDMGPYFTDVEGIEDDISNYISDESGYYHEGFSYEWVKEETKMEKFTEDELAVVNYTLKSLLSVVREELKKIPDGGEVSDEVRTINTIKNLIYKINK